MDQPASGSSPKPSTPRAAWNASGIWLLLLLLVALGFLLFVGNDRGLKVITYDVFRKQLDANNIKQVEFADHELTGKFKEIPGGKPAQSKQPEDKSPENKARENKAPGDKAPGDQGFGDQGARR